MNDDTPTVGPAVDRLSSLWKTVNAGMYRGAAANAIPIGEYNRQLLTDAVFIALAAHDAALLAAQPSPETVWRQGYYTGKRDYAASITGGASISTPNPYGPEGADR